MARHARNLSAFILAINVLLSSCRALCGHTLPQMFLQPPPLHQPGGEGGGVAIYCSAVTHTLMINWNRYFDVLTSSLRCFLKVQTQMTVKMFSYNWSNSFYISFSKFKIVLEISALVQTRLRLFWGCWCNSYMLGWSHSKNSFRISLFRFSLKANGLFCFVSS